MSREILQFCVLAFSFVLSACVPTEEATVSDQEQVVTHTVSQFTADYYDGETFVATEVVDRPSINYIYSDFHSILSQDFHATWSGSVEVLTADPQRIDINFDVSWSDVTLTIDGIEADSWSNSNKSIGFDFTEGTHDIVIEYYNNWHTTGFNVSFTTNTEYPNYEATALLQSSLDVDPTLIYVGAYEASDRYNDIEINIEAAPSPVVLFLSTYTSVNWNINNPNDVDVLAVVYSAYAPRPTVSAEPSLATFEVQELRYGYDNFANPIADITSLVGRAPDFTYGTYALGQIVINIPAK